MPRRILSQNGLLLTCCIAADSFGVVHGRLKQSERQISLSGHFAGTDRSLIAYAIWGNSGMGHRLKELQGSLPLPTDPARTDGGIVGRAVWYKPTSLHRRKERQGHLPAPALLTGADGCGVADHVGRDVGFRHGT